MHAFLKWNALMAAYDISLLTHFSWFPYFLSLNHCDETVLCCKTNRREEYPKDIHTIKSKT